MKKKGWALKSSNGSLYNSGINDVTPDLFRTRAIVPSINPKLRPVRVEVEVLNWPLRGQGKKAFAVQLTKNIFRPQFAHDGLNDVTPALFKRKRDAEAWLANNFHTKTPCVVPVWVLIRHL